jgi:hypothetical protein
MTASLMETQRVYQCVCRIVLISTYINTRFLIFFRFGFFYVLPLTAPKVVSTPDPTISPASFNSNSHDFCDVTFGDYNVSTLNF